MTQSMDAFTLPDVLTDNTLTTFYFEERSTLALKNGTIITHDIHALRLKDIREHIRTNTSLHNGLFVGQNLPIKQVDSSVINEYFERSQLATQSNQHIDSDDTDVSQRLKRLQQKAVNLGSSDIHIELYEQETQFYARVDGRRVQLEHTIPMHEVGEKLFGYIFTAKADTTDNDFVTMTPNNGQIAQLLDCPVDKEIGKTEQRLTQWRASYIPTKGGGKITLRWLDASKTIPPLESMGLHPGHITLLKDFCFGNSGLCMIAGKVGSGKSTLIAALLKLFGKDKAVHTLEDPPEFNLGIPQTHATPNQKVNDEEFVRGFNYYSKVLLRHDVDVELHGEVRDNKGAMEVTRKGETGQILFTTLHTSSAMGIGHTLTEQLHVPAAVVAAPDLMRIWAYQTLVRTLCPHCKMDIDTASAYYDSQGKNNAFSKLMKQSQQVCGKQAQNVFFKHPEGCKHCVEGEKGRTALFEIIVLDDEDRAFILNKDYLGWQAVLKAKGFKNVRDHAISKIKAGMIDIETASQKVAHLIPVQSQAQYQLLDYGEATELIDTPTAAQEVICNLNAP
jgi:general secretion pathway protein E